MKTLIIGERINSSIARVRSILQKRDTESLLELAEAQLEGGASYIDINSSMMMDKERETMLWAGNAISERFDAKISIDSADPAILVEGAEAFGAGSIVNSLTCDASILREIVPSLSGTGASMIILLKDLDGIPVSAADRVGLGRRAAEIVFEAGIDPGRVFFDPVFSPVAMEKDGLSVALETIAALKSEMSEFGRVGGLSNISFGLPMRRLLNRTFLAMAVSRGLSAAICDPTDLKLMETLKSAEALTGMDPGCREFLRHYRNRKGK